MSQELRKAIYEIRDDAAALQKKVDAIEKLRNLSLSEIQMAREAGNTLRGFRGFALGSLASAAGIEKLEI